MKITIRRNYNNGDEHIFMNCDYDKAVILLETMFNLSFEETEGFTCDCCPDWTFVETNTYDTDAKWDINLPDLMESVDEGVTFIFC